jgi:LysM repeat protein
MQRHDDAAGTGVPAAVYHRCHRPLQGVCQKIRTRGTDWLPSRKVLLFCAPMTPFPNRLTTGLAVLAACFLLPSCENTQKSGYDHVVDYTSPNTKLSKEEYPFDEDGNYREDWAARGAGTTGVKDKPTDTALYTQPSDSVPPSHPAYTPDPEPVRTTASTGSSTPRKTTSSSSSKPKPKPKPRPAAKPTYVKVKSGDTLYGLSKRYGVSVASIKAANGLKSDLIVDGRSLKIPKKK